MKAGKCTPTFNICTCLVDVWQPSAFQDGILSQGPQDFGIQLGMTTREGTFLLAVSRRHFRTSILLTEVQLSSGLTLCAQMYSPSDFLLLGRNSTEKLGSREAKKSRTLVAKLP